MKMINKDLFVPLEREILQVQKKEETLGYWQDAKIGCTVEKIETGNRGNSILEQVRGAVNANIHQIHEMIGQHLYANYGIKPRPVEEILKIKYNNGQEELKFNYDLTSERKTPTRFVVTTSTDGKIKSVYTTR